MSFFSVEATSKVGPSSTVRRPSRALPRQPAAVRVVQTEAAATTIFDVDVQVLNKAIEAHTQWKTKLRQCMGDRSKCADPATVEKDNLCGLGQWICGDGRRLASEPLFERLRVDHAAFHKCAARIIREIQGNRLNEAERLMAGEYAEISGKVIGALTKMKASCR